MAYQRKLSYEFSIKELDRELIARGAQIPAEQRFKFEDRDGTPARKAIMEQAGLLYHPDTSPSLNEELSHIETWELAETLANKIEEAKGIWGNDDRLDFCEIRNEQVKKNVQCTAAICLTHVLIDMKNGFSTLKHKNYGKTFNLCKSEPFHQQPIAAGTLCTGFLVKDDVIATAGHCAGEKNVTDLRFVFGFRMSDTSTPATQVPNKNIYKGVKIIHRVYDPMGSGADWALVKLDNKVNGQTVAKLSKVKVSRDQPVYILGHPCGLPLKYATGAQVRTVDKCFFSADLNVYCGNSGSPVFNEETHEVIGLVARGDNQDFRWTGKGWRSIIYPHPVLHSNEPQCTKVLEFIDYCG